MASNDIDNLASVLEDLVTARPPKVTCSQVSHHAPELHYPGDPNMAVARQHVLLGDQNKEELVLHELKMPGHSLVVVWRKPLPAGLRYDCHKFLTGSTIGLQNQDGETTYTYDMDLTPQQQYPTGDFGRLCGALIGDRLAYVTQLSRKQYQVSVYQLPNHTPLATLSRPQGPLNKYWVSICCHDNSKSLAVVCHGRRKPHSLDIYTAQYSHLTHVALPFTPAFTTAVASIKDWILVADHSKPHLHTYSWQGEYINRVDLDISGCIKAIGGARFGHMWVCTGPYWEHVTNVTVFAAKDKAKHLSMIMRFLNKSN